MDYTNAIHFIPDAWTHPAAPSTGGDAATEDDYRKWNHDPSSRAASEQPLPSGKKRSIGKMFFKTKLCCKFRAGTCPYVTNCKFAHGMEELRKPPRRDRRPASPPGAPPFSLLNEEAVALGYGNAIHFCPGVQQEAAIGITEQVAELLPEKEERREAIVDSILVPCEQQPLLEKPAPHGQKNKASPAPQGQKNKAATGLAKTVKAIAGGGLRRSSRQQEAKSCSVPVSRRATHRLIKAFGMEEPIGEEALEALAKRFGTPLSQEQIAAVKEAYVAGL